MLLQSKNIFYQIAHGEMVISPAYLWILIAVATILFIYFLLKTNKNFDNKNQKTEASNTPVTEQNTVNREISGDEAAAIAMALSLYKKEFDHKMQLKATLQRVSKVYSPWNSKIYTLRQNPR